ncbi:SulP family inorganic anion transporter, partial [Bacillus paralicheniformis]
IGFTSGIAVIIFVGQIANFLGLTGVEKHETFLSNIREIIIHIHSINFYSVLTAGICLIAVLLTPKFSPKVPGPLIGLLFSTVIASIFYPNQIATIGSTFGEIPSALPHFKVPEMTFERVQQLIGPAFVIALLGG